MNQRRILRSIFSAGLILVLLAPAWAMAAQQPPGPEVLREWREEARRSCDPNPSPLANLAQTPGTFANVLNDGFRKQFLGAANDQMQNQLWGQLGGQLQNQMGNVIQQQLRTQLPNYVRGRINVMVQGGSSNSQIDQALPGLYRDGVNELVPQIVKARLPQIMLALLDQIMPQLLTSGFDAILPAIIKNNPGLQTQIEQLVKTAASANDGSGQILTDAGDLNKLCEGVNTGMIEASREGIEGSREEIHELSRALSALIINHFENLIVQFFTASANMQNIVNQFAGQGGGFGGTTNRHYGGGHQWSNDISADLTGTPFLTQIGYDIAPSVGQWTTNSLFPPDVALPSVAELNAELAADLNPIDTSEIVGANGEFGLSIEGENGVFIPVEGIANNASDSVANSGAQIGQTATKNLSSGLGNTLKGGLSDGIAGGVGSLVNNIPIAGGFLAPVATQVLNQVLNQLLGVTPAAGFPVNDIGVNFGLQNVNKSLGNINQHTEASNKNEEKIIELSQQVVTLQQQICEYTAVLNRLQEKEFVYNPSVVKKIGQEFVNTLGQWLTFLNKGRYTHPADTGVPPEPGNNTGPVPDIDFESGGFAGGDLAAQNNGEPLYVQNQAEERAKIAKEKDALHQAGIDAVAGLDQSVKNELRSIATQETTRSPYDVLKPSAGLKDPKTDPATKIALSLLPGNNGPSQVFNSLNIHGDLIAQANQDERDKLIANQGFKDIVKCVGDVVNGVCTVLQTVTPGSAIAAFTMKMITALIDQAINAKDVTTDAITHLFDQPEQAIVNLSEPPTYTNPGQDPCQGPGPCQDSGWNGTVRRAAQGGISAGVNIGLQKVFDGSGNGGSSSGDNRFNLNNFQPPNPDIPPIPAIISNFQFNKEIDGSTTIGWTSINSLYCTPTNNWFGTEPAVGPENVFPAIWKVSIAHPGPTEEGYQIACYGLNPLTEPAAGSLATP